MYQELRMYSHVLACVISACLCMCWGLLYVSACVSCWSCFCICWPLSRAENVPACVCAYWGLQVYACVGSISRALCAPAFGGLYWWLRVYLHAHSHIEGSECTSMCCQVLRPERVWASTCTCGCMITNTGFRCCVSCACVCDLCCTHTQIQALGAVFHVLVCVTSARWFLYLYTNTHRL
jgi:hypothetical protein